MSISVKNVASKANPIGKYLWRKYEKAYAVVTPIELISRSPVTVKLEITGDIEAVAVDRLDGFTFGIFGNTGMLHMFCVLPDGIAEDSVNGGASDCTYDPVAQTLTLDTFSITNETGELSEYTPKTIDIKELIGYAVSDNETQYPDGGVHTDGLWYESHKLLLPFGIRDIEVQEKVFTAPAYIKTLEPVKHNLNKVPRAVFIFCNDKLEKMYPNSVVFAYCIVVGNQAASDAYRTTRYLYYDGTLKSEVSGPFTCYEDKVEFSGSAGASENTALQMGAKYDFVFIA